MEQFFNGIFDFFTTIVNFIATLLYGFGKFFSMIPGVFLFMSESVGYLPSFIAPFFVLGISLLVIKVILDLL